MVKARALDDDFDLAYKAGRQQMKEDQDVYLQGIQVAIATVKGEQVFHPNFGLNIDAVTAKSEVERRAALKSAVMRSRRARAVSRIIRVDEANAARVAQYSIGVILPDDEEVAIGVTVG